MDGLAHLLHLPAFLPSALLTLTPIFQLALRRFSPFPYFLPENDVWVSVWTRWFFASPGSIVCSPPSDAIFFNNAQNLSGRSTLPSFHSCARVRERSLIRSRPLSRSKIAPIYSFSLFLLVFEVDRSLARVEVFSSFSPGPHSFFFSVGLNVSPFWGAFLHAGFLICWLPDCMHSVPIVSFLDVSRPKTHLFPKPLQTPSFCTLLLVSFRPSGPWSLPTGFFPNARAV